MDGDDRDMSAEEGMTMFARSARPSASGAAMRMMLKWTADTAKANETMERGAGMEVIESMLKDLQPEAAYFFTTDGKRSGVMVFDMRDASQIPRIAEPLFVDFHAAVEFVPVMSPEDLRAALANA